MTHIRGKFLEIVGDLGMMLEAEYGLQPYSGPDEAQNANYRGYEIDETEGNAPGSNEIFGYITIYLIIKQAGQRIRRIVELRSANGFPSASPENAYFYSIPQEDFDGLVDANIR